ncbi:MAG: hypothetical protein KJ950_11250 [Proteobacteria bacterium]|nr:hypothetical protein [Pseudomonadota bacterium]MBU1688305.1 hypothetical protein [Pseudomonadota bacterium]
MNKPEQIPPEDEFQIRCRKLGHLIHFGYCRQEQEGLPCAKALDCWYAFFPVEESLRGELTADEWRQAFDQPQVPKVLSLVELIERAQKNTGKL